jgi:4-amino-4-deoxychorismate lyase
MLVNGRRDDNVAAADRGLHYGDGLFETLAVAHGRPQLWERHMRRLAIGCERLGLDSPAPSLLLKECRQVAAGRRRGVLKMILTRGIGGRGYRPPESAATTRVIAWYPPPVYPSDWWTRGVRVRHCRTRLGLNPMLAGIKHLNRLEQVLARQEWSDDGIAEGLMCDAGGRVIEGTMSNLFVILDDALWTPSLARCGVAGVMREAIMDAAKRLGMPVHCADIPVDRIAAAEALFLSNSLIGLLPVREIDGRALDLHPIPQGLRDAAADLGLFGAGGESGPEPASVNGPCTGC